MKIASLKALLITAVVWAAVAFVLPILPAPQWAMGFIGAYIWPVLTVILLALWIPRVRHPHYWSNVYWTVVANIVGGGAAISYYMPRSGLRDPFDYIFFYYAAFIINVLALVLAVGWKQLRAPGTYSTKAHTIVSIIGPLICTLVFPLFIFAGPGPLFILFGILIVFTVIISVSLFSPPHSRKQWWSSILLLLVSVLCLLWLTRELVLALL